MTLSHLAETIVDNFRRCNRVDKCKWNWLLYPDRGPYRYSWWYCCMWLQNKLQKIRNLACFTCLSHIARFAKTEKCICCAETSAAIVALGGCTRLKQMFSLSWAEKDEFGTLICSHFLSFYVKGLTIVLKYSQTVDSQQAIEHWQVEKQRDKRQRWATTWDHRDLTYSTADNFLEIHWPFYSPEHIFPCCGLKIVIAAGQMLFDNRW